MSERIEWWFHDAKGRRVFQHFRFPRQPSTDNDRTKGYGYRYPREVSASGCVLSWNDAKHADADKLVYRLPVVLASRGQHLWLTEGERDADALSAVGCLASSHHGGAGKFTEAQAESLAGHRGLITLVADRDLPGAYDACRRFDLLRAAGLPARRLRVVRAAVAMRGADAREHLAAGYGLKDFVSVDIRSLRVLARHADAASFAAGGYGLPDPLRDPLSERWP